jgi:hypothetical protein
MRRKKKDEKEWTVIFHWIHLFLVSHQNGIGGEPDSMDREEQQHHKSFGYVCSMGRKVYSIQDTQSLEWMTSRVSSRSLSLVASLVGQLRQTLPSNSNIKGPGTLCRALMTSRGAIQHWRPSSSLRFHPVFIYIFDGIIRRQRREEQTKRSTGRKKRSQREEIGFHDVW